MRDKSQSNCLLNFLYNRTVGKIFRPIFTLSVTSKFAGFFADCSISRILINRFIKKNKIDMTQFDVPTYGYKTFNAFFYRKLKPDARRIDADQNAFVSPADSNLLVIPNVSKETPFFVKDLKFDLFKFLKNDELAQEFLGGTLLLFRLAPEDYHRFHFPCDCVPSVPKIINGKLESVNPVAYSSGVQPLTENERHLILLNSDTFDKVLFVPVGAMFVGRVVETFTPSKRYSKGDEIGYFAFGGSSIVMLFKKGQIQVEDLFLQNSFDCVETAVKMGQRVGVKK